MAQNIYHLLSNIKDLSPSERQVVTYILENSEEAMNLNIVEMGARSYTSSSTITRVFKKLGFDGFNDFKFKLIQDQSKYIQAQDMFVKKENILLDDDVEAIIKKTINNSVVALKSVEVLNSPETFQKVVNWMCTHKSINFYGQGVSNLICRDAMIKGLRAGCNVTAHSSFSEMMMQAKLNTQDDLAFLISYTGQTDEIIKIARSLKRNGVTTVSITANTNNSLLELCDVNMFVDNSENIYRVGGMESRISIQSVLDILFSIYFSQSTKAQRAIEKTFVEETFQNRE